MSEITPNEEFVKANFDSTVKLVEKLSTTSHLKTMLEFLGDRYALCPASANKDYFSAFPGGLAYHNLNVVKWIGKFANLLCPDVYSKETLLKVALLAEIGKVGDLEHDYYLATDQKWQRDRGIFYEINKDISFMRIPQRSLFLANNFGVPLTQEEYLAILLFEGQNDETNSAYKYREPKLSLILQYANQWAQRSEKENVVNFP